MFRTVFVSAVIAMMAWSLCAEPLSHPPKILHISFHRGCIRDVEEVAKSLGFELTSWFVQDDHVRFDGESELSNDIYNVTREKAQRVWELNKEYFDSFDAVITSDTAPLSRIFIQNGWSKPLVIWVCNRFDYSDAQTANGRFPDAEYYELFSQARTLKNVRIISYTRYEHVYARRKGVEIGTEVINPVGRLPVPFCESESSIGSHINKEEYLFLYPRLENDAAVEFVKSQCAAQGIANVYHGSYNGPEDLARFKAVLYFPYAWSNLALFENLQQGIVHFVPSEKFVKDLSEHMRMFTTTEFELCDWWAPEFRERIVYFDSFADLKNKIETTRYADLKKSISEAGAAHRTDMLARWQRVFNELLAAH